ncbi:MAG: hypothetical protein ACD_39C01131G0001 [uncultured bacterium]|nr:MAG: hypothetical protein ACD_39C01131G0001 [uncultured bacterium]
MNRHENTGNRLLFTAASSSIALHLMFGQFGWFSRYEIYIWASTLGILGYVLKPSIYSDGNGIKPHEKTILLFAGMFLLCFPYLIVLPNIPVAAGNIYEQHYQMHRFAVEFYKKPVAANDIGYVSYLNPVYILDLMGLASSEALLLRVHSNQKNWMDNLAKAKNVELAMIYDDWFEHIPESWIKLGELKLRNASIKLLRDKVAFYSLNADSAQEICSLLEEFAATLPAGATFDFTGHRSDDTGNQEKSEDLLSH